MTKLAPVSRVPNLQHASGPRGLRSGGAAAGGARRLVLAQLHRPGPHWRPLTALSAPGFARWGVAAPTHPTLPIPDQATLERVHPQPSGLGARLPTRGGPAKTSYGFAKDNWHALVFRSSTDYEQCFIDYNQ